MALSLSILFLKKIKKNKFVGFMAILLEKTPGFCPARRRAVWLGAIYGIVSMIFQTPFPIVFSKNCTARATTHVPESPDM